MIEHGARVICIHGRTRGSTKKRRCGPADLAAIATIARTLHEEFHQSTGVVLLSNGNITTTEDARAALVATHPCSGVMSAEGLLANPALFEQMSTSDSSYSEHLTVSLNEEEKRENDATALVAPTRKRTTAEVAQDRSTSLLALFREYCELSVQYQQLGGWAGLDAYYRRSHGGGGSSVNGPAAPMETVTVTETGQGSSSSALAGHQATSIPSTASPLLPPPLAVAGAGAEARGSGGSSSAYIPEPRQVYIARQHLAWMLGKSGHGRMVRYVYIGAQYRKHVHLKDALNGATSLEDLLVIAEHCLPS